MNKPKKKGLTVSWEEVEDPDFAEHLRRVFTIITSASLVPTEEDETHITDAKQEEKHLGPEAQ
jgi:ribosomal 30S subunit maturation factor RimM